MQTKGFHGSLNEKHSQLPYALHIYVHMCEVGEGHEYKLNYVKKILIKHNKSLIANFRKMFAYLSKKVGNFAH